MSQYGTITCEERFGNYLFRGFGPCKDSVQVEQPPSVLKRMCSPSPALSFASWSMTLKNIATRVRPRTQPCFNSFSMGKVSEKLPLTFASCWCARMKSSRCQCSEAYVHCRSCYSSHGCKNFTLEISAGADPCIEVPHEFSSENFSQVMVKSSFDPWFRLQGRSIHADNDGKLVTLVGRFKDIKRSERKVLKFVCNI